jgi:hypothetical protein
MRADASADGFASQPEVLGKEDDLVFEIQLSSPVGLPTANDGLAIGAPFEIVLTVALPEPDPGPEVIIPHHETFRTIIQPPYSSTKG